MTVAIQNGKHEVHEPDVSRLLLNRKTGDQMPARVSVVALAALADLNGGFDLQSDGFTAFFHGRVDQVRIGLIGIVLERRVIM